MSPALRVTQCPSALFWGHRAHLLTLGKLCGGEDIQMILKLAGGKREAGQRGREEGLSQWKEQTLQITEVAPQVRVQVVLSSWTLVGRQVLKGSQEPDHKGLSGQFCCVIFVKSPFVSGLGRKTSGLLGSWSLRLLLLFPSWAPGIRTHSGAGRASSRVWQGKGKATSRKGWAVTACPNDGEAWLISLPPPPTHHRSAQTLFLNRDPIHGGNLRSPAGHKTKIQRSG